MSFPVGAQPGLDVSHYQAAVNWNQVSQGGEVFAIAKASDGTTADDYFVDNWSGMKSAGLIRGSYHYFYPDMDAGAQANAFLKSLSDANGGSPVLNPGDLPAALDLEITKGVDTADIIAGATTWLQTVQNATGKQPMLYTYVSFWRDTLGNPTDLSSYPLWIAEFQVTAPIVPGGWANWYFWQFDQQPVGGISSAVVDLDAFNGTLADLRNFAGLPMSARGKSSQVRVQGYPRRPIGKAPLTFDQVKSLVASNKHAAAFTDECVIAVCWKESSFNPSAQASGSTAKGLMQMTNPAVDTVNNITPQGVHFDYADMLDAAMAIQCGTYYLEWCSDQSGGDETKALNKYAGVSGYADDVIAAEACLLSGGNPMTCLGAIHSFAMQRRQKGLLDDPTGRSRFMLAYNIRIDHITQGPEGQEKWADRLSVNSEKFLWIYVEATLPQGSAVHGEYFQMTGGTPDPAAKVSLDPPSLVNNQYRFSVLHYVLGKASSYLFHFAEDLDSPNYEDQWEIRTE